MSILEKLMNLVDESRRQQLFGHLIINPEEGTSSFTPGVLDEVIDGQTKAKQTAQKCDEEQSAVDIEEVTCMDLPMDWENLFQADERTQGVHADSIPDGLILSLSNLGKVDIEYIASVTGADYKTVIATLKGAIFQNPETWGECFYQGWETAEEYLSGNLMRKWQIADEANRTYNGYFSDNLKAIEMVLPSSVATKDIYITLGSPWVPVDVIDDFINYILGKDGERYRFRTHLQYRFTKHDELTGTWELPEKAHFSHNVRSESTYGTPRMPALYILEKTLNMKTVAVTDEVPSRISSTGVKREVNKAETLLALEKQSLLIKTFRKWVWRDEVRKNRLQAIFEDKFSAVRRRIYDGSFLQFPTMSPDIQLYPYQKNAVARILFSPNTLLAHDVGSGKTFVMIAAGMELIRMRLSKKNLYVVPNNIIGQWESIYQTMYPNAKILCVTPASFIPKKREAVLQRIRDEEFDGIIMAYSCFEQIPISKAFYKSELEDEKRQIQDLISQNKKATSKLKKRLETINKEIAKLDIAQEDTSMVFFDALGITRLFVDEAHNFKNVPIETKVDKVLGISSRGSSKCRDMMDKVHLVQKNNNGGGVIMATGTPITNSITDVYVMQQYLQSGELALLDLQSFDSWIGMFAEKVTDFEIDVDTSSYRLATRFSKFHNLPELTGMLASIADFHAVDKEDGLPEFDGYKDVLIPKTVGFSEYLSEISNRAEDVRGGLVDRQDDNMLKITTDGRKAALDLRLVKPNSGFTYLSKVAYCAEKVAEIYLQTYANRSTQIVFCDTSTPHAGFNLYDELRRLLEGFGIQSDEIAYIHDAETEARRAKLFTKMRNGEVRILIGSTFKLGLGVNVQDKLIAIHHLDVPWRPADMTQREGRILRQGNTNPRVYIYRYITEGSFDAYSWQLLETKQRYINEILSGSMSERMGADIESTVLNYAEVKALAVGNPLVKKRVETANELTRLMTLQRKVVDNRLKLEKELLELPSLIESQLKIIEKCRADLAFCQSEKKEYTKEEQKAVQEARKGIRTEIYNAVSQNILVSAETTLMEYRGFQIVLPANMIEQMPYVWLVREGKYYVELGNSEVGGLIRIDNFLDTLSEHLARLEEALEKLQTREAYIKAELAKDENYTEEIEKCVKKLDAIDKKLGVNEK